MTLESALLSAITAVTGGLVYVSHILWTRSEKCESHRLELQKRIDELGSANGVNRGRLEMVQQCPVKDCPFSDLELTQLNLKQRTKPQA